MAINKTAMQKQSDEVIKNILTLQPNNRKHKKEKKLKNLRIDAELIAKYEILCENILKSSFTDEITKYIENSVKENIEKIEKLLDIVKM